MKLNELFKKEENLQLEKRTLVILRWIATIGQLITIAAVYFLLEFNFPFFSCIIIITFGGITNIYLQFWFKKNELNNLESTLFLFHDLLQLSLLLYFTGGITNPFIIFLIVPSIVSSTLLTIKSTIFLATSTVFILLILSFYYFPLPHFGDLHFHVPDYYLLSFPIAITIVLLFLSYFGGRFGFESRKRTEALNKLEMIIAKEKELESIGHQAAAAAHSLGTPLSTITVIAKELKNEISKDAKYEKDIDLLLSQAKRCSEILKKISLNQMQEDEFVDKISIQILLSEIIRSFQETSKKRISLNLNEAKKKILIKRSPEITYGIRNFIGNAIKYAESEVKINLSTNYDKTKIAIIDNGPGFPEDILEVIGQPYISSKSEVLKKKSGLGLGTFIGKTLLERKKAYLSFSNIEKKGASVNIEWNTSDIII